MNLCTVLGTVVATEKHQAFHARKLLVVQPVDSSGRACGSSYLAVDNISGAGQGDLVLVLNEGSGARQVLEDKQACIRSVVVGVVDQVAEAANHAPFGKP